MNMPSLITLPNGPKMRATFSVTELNRRLAMLRAQLQALELDAVVLTSIHNVNYFGDFLYCSFGRSYALVVTQDRSTLITTNIDGGQGYRRSLGDNLIYTDWQRDNYFRAVREAVPQGARRVRPRVRPCQPRSST